MRRPSSSTSACRQSVRTSTSTPVAAGLPGEAGAAASAGSAARRPPGRRPSAPPPRRPRRREPRPAARRGTARRRAPPPAFGAARRWPGSDHRGASAAARRPRGRERRTRSAAVRVRRGLIGGSSRERGQPATGGTAGRPAISSRRGAVPAGAGSRSGCRPGVMLPSTEACRAPVPERQGARQRRALSGSPAARRPAPPWRPTRRPGRRWRTAATPGSSSAIMRISVGLCAPPPETTSRVTPWSRQAPATVTAVSRVSVANTSCGSGVGASARAASR